MKKPLSSVRDIQDYCLPIVAKYVFQNGSKIKQMLSVLNNINRKYIVITKTGNDIMGNLVSFEEMCLLMVLFHKASADCARYATNCKNGMQWIGEYEGDFACIMDRKTFSMFKKSVDTNAKNIKRGRRNF